MKLIAQLRLRVVGLFGIVGNGLPLAFDQRPFGRHLLDIALLDLREKEVVGDLRAGTDRAREVPDQQDDQATDQQKDEALWHGLAVATLFGPSVWSIALPVAVLLRRGRVHLNSC